MGILNALRVLWRTLRRDHKRRQNRRLREAMRVAGFPMPDTRDWSGQFVKSLKP